MHPWVQKFYPVLGLESGERLLWHFQTPVLYWINFSLQSIQSTQNLSGNLSGVGESSRGYGSASLSEVLNRQAAACASQGAIDRLGTREHPEQIDIKNH